MSPTLDIVIVNWNSGTQLRECLESIVAAGKVLFRLSRVVVVDNASTDGSIHAVEGLDLPLTIIRNVQNLGFAAACNQGAKASQADCLLFLNPDTRLSHSSLSKAVAFMERSDNRRIGILGIQLVDESGKVSRTCSRFPTPCTYFSKILGLARFFPQYVPSEFMVNWDHGDSREVDQVMGAFLMVRRPLFEELGGFDERFFVYFEEVDLALRARKAGSVCYYLADAQAFHRGGGTSRNVRAARLFYNLRSRILYAYKHFGWWAATAVLLATLALEPFSRLFLAIAHRSGLEALETLDGFVRLWARVPRVLLR